MKKIAFITLALATVYTVPAFAQDSQAMCKLMATYQPGVDIHGNAVVPADLKAAAGVNDVIKIPVTIDLAQSLQQHLPTGTKMDAGISMIEIHKDGKVTYNGTDVTQAATTVCAATPKSYRTADASDVTGNADDTMPMSGEAAIDTSGSAEIQPPAGGPNGAAPAPAPAAQTPPPADLTAPIPQAPAPAAQIQEPAPAPAAEAAPAPAPEATAAAPAEEAAPAPVEKKKAAVHHKAAKPKRSAEQVKADAEATAAAEAAARSAVTTGTATMGTTPPSAPIGDGAAATVPAPASAPAETGTTDHAGSGDVGESDPQFVGEAAAKRAGVNLGTTISATSDTSGASSATVTGGATATVPAPTAAPAETAAPAAPAKKDDGAIIWGQGN